MKINYHANIWEFDVDNTLVLWDISKYSDVKKVYIPSTTLIDPELIELAVHVKNVKLLVKLAKIGWYIRVHSGSGVVWADAVVRALGIEKYVDEISAKPRGRTDDMRPGDGLAYDCYRDPITGQELNKV